MKYVVSAFDQPANYSSALNERVDCEDLQDHLRNLRVRKIAVLRIAPARRNAPQFCHQSEALGSLSADACCPHASASHKRYARDEKRRFEPRQCPIATHGCASIVDNLGAGCV